MTFGALPLEAFSRSRFFDEVDTLTGTAEADTLVVTPVGIPRDFFQTQGIRVGIEVIEPSLDLGFFSQPGLQSLDDNFIAMGIPTIVDSSEDTEVDLLVYQEADSFDYIPGFTNPPESSYTIIEDFDLIEDEIFVGENRVGITPLPRNDIPMLSDVIEPSLGDIGDDFEYAPLFQ